MVKGLPKLESFLPPEARALRRMTKARYGGPDRRRRPRITIDELNRYGAEALRRDPDIRKKRGGIMATITKVLDVIDLPRNLVANIIGKIAGTKTGKLEKGALGVPRVYVSEILKQAGVKSAVVGGIAGFLGDVAIDPLVYLSAGAMTGKKLAQYLPRMLPPGWRQMKRAARTGVLSPELVKVVGASRAARLGRLQQAARRKLGPRAGQKRLLKRLKGEIVRRARRGQAGALGYLAKFGQKGRTLFRVPFTSLGGPTIRVGAKARRYRRILETMKDVRGVRHLERLRRSVRKGQQAIQVAATAKKLAAAREAVTQARKGKAQAAWVQRRMAQLQAGQTFTPRGARRVGVRGFEMGRGGEAAIRRVLTKRMTLPKEAAARFTKQQKQIAAQLKAAKEAGKGAAERIAARRGEISRFATSPEAPGVLKELGRTQMGPAYIKGAPGFVQRLYQAKRRMFGPGRSEVWQQLVGARSAYTAGAAFRGARAGVLLGKEVQPVVARLAKQTGRSADEIGALLTQIAEAGPQGKMLGSFMADDAIRQVWAQADQLGITRDPQVQQVLAGYFRKVEGLGGKVEGYVHRVSTKEASKYLRLQEEAFGALPGKRLPGGRLSPIQASDIQRSHWLIFKNAAGQQERVLSSRWNAGTLIPQLQKQGYKQVGKQPISMAQWNQWSQRGELAKLLGADRPSVKPFRGKLFEESLPRTYAERVREFERKGGARMFQQAVEPSGVSVPAAGVGYTRYAHLAKVPNVPKPGNPYYELVRSGMFQRKYPGPVADMIDEMIRVVDQPQAIQNMMRATDVTLSFWKRWTLYHPAYVLRNCWQNLFGGMMAGAGPMQTIRFALSPSVRKLRRAVMIGDPAMLRGVTINLGGRALPAGSLYKLAERYHLVGAGQTSQMMSARWAAQTGATAAAARVGEQAGKGAANVVFRFNTAMEDRMRLGTWLQFIDRGMQPKDAAIRVLVAMPDLSDLVLWERNIARRIIPFYSWMRRNGALQLLHYLPRKPALAAMLPRLQNMVEGVRGHNVVEKELRPEWMRENMAWQILGNRESGVAFLPTTWFPFEEMHMAMAGVAQPGEAVRRGLGMLRPGIRFGMELGTGYDVFRRMERPGGTKITSAELFKAFPQALAGRSGTALDTLVTLRPIREMTRVAEMPTAGGAVTRAIAGGAFQPISRRRGLAAEYVRLRDKVRDLRMRINRALQVNDQSEAENLRREWLQTVMRMMRMGLPGVAKGTQKMLTDAGVEAGPPAFPER